MTFITLPCGTSKSILWGFKKRIWLGGELAGANHRDGDRMLPGAPIEVTHG